MACSGGGVPAERAAAAVSYLIDVREGLMRLKRVLLPEEKSTAAAAAEPWAEQLMDGMMNKLSSAILALGGAVVGDTDAAGRQSLVAGPEPADGVVIRQTGESPAVRTRKRSSRRSRQPSDKRVAAKPDDGHVWRKYGQKNIQNSPYPRSYYRCTHRSDQGCRATKQVQLSETDPSMHVITYYGQHTCRDPSAVIPPTAADIPTAGASNMMISFVSPVSYSHAAAAGGAALVMEAGTSTTRLSPSWCTSGGGDDVFSSSSEPPPAFVQWDELAAAVAGSAGVTSSSMVGSAAPAESGGVGDTAGGGGYGGGGGSSPSSPSAGSLGFVVGSLGSIGDDGFFPFDQ